MILDIDTFIKMGTKQGKANRWWKLKKEMDRYKNRMMKVLYR